MLKAFKTQLNIALKKASISAEFGLEISKSLFQNKLFFGFTKEVMYSNFHFRNRKIEVEKDKGYLWRTVNITTSSFHMLQARCGHNALRPFLYISRNCPNM